MKDISNNQSGYTLIEVIIAVQIFLIVLTMTYTIYLFGYKYMVRWNNDNNLLATELLIQKSLSNELTTAKKIIEISEQEIVYTDRNYNLQKIYWSNDSLVIKDKPVNNARNKIAFQKMRFLQKGKNYHQYSPFTQFDLNNDHKISYKELERICMLNYEFIIFNRSKNHKVLFIQNI